MNRKLERLVIVHDQQAYNYIKQGQQGSPWRLSNSSPSVLPPTAAGR
jgi:hypothetical protein